MSDLRPCDRCGGTDIEADPVYGGPYCVGCGWTTSGEFQTPDEARVLWNQRPIEDALRAELAEARGLLARVNETRVDDIPAWLRLLREILNYLNPPYSPAEPDARAFTERTTHHAPDGAEGE